MKSKENAYLLNWYRAAYPTLPNLLCKQRSSKTPLYIRLDSLLWLVSRWNVNQLCLLLTRQTLQKDNSMQVFTVYLSWDAFFCLKSEQLCASSAAQHGVQHESWQATEGHLAWVPLIIFDWIILTGLYAKTFNTASLCWSTLLYTTCRANTLPKY